MSCFESINFNQNELKIKLFLENILNFLSAGGYAPKPPKRLFPIADFWLRVCYETYAAPPSNFYNLSMRSFRASRITTAI